MTTIASEVHGTEVRPQSRGGCDHTDSRHHRRLSRSPSEETTIKVGASLFVLTGICGSLAWAAQEGFNFARVATSSMAVGGAACLVGCLIGFLFGIPRAHEADESDKPEPAAGPARIKTAGSHGNGYRPNTNLEQISDWLTKILIGVGLTELAQAPHAADVLGNALRPMLGNIAESAGFGVAWSLYAAIGGFFCTYLWTRLKLGAALRAADALATAAEFRQMQESVAAVALRLADTQAVATELQSVKESIAALKVSASLK